MSDPEVTSGGEADESCACNLISGVTSCIVGSEQIVCTTDRQGWYVDSLKLVALERRNDDGFVQQSVSALRDGQNVIQDDLDAFLLVRGSILHHTRRRSQNDANGCVAGHLAHRPKHEI